MILGIGNQFQNLRNPKGPTTPPVITWFIELEDGTGFMELQASTDLMLLEAAP